MVKKCVFLSLLLFVAGCARLQIKDRSQAMRKSSSPPSLSDDLGFESLSRGLKADLEFIKTSSRVPAEMTFGPSKISKKKYVAALELLLEKSLDLTSFQQNIEQNFDFYEVYGLEDWSRVKAT